MSNGRLQAAHGQLRGTSLEEAKQIVTECQLREEVRSTRETHLAAAPLHPSTTCSSQPLASDVVRPGQLKHTGGTSRRSTRQEHGHLRWPTASTAKSGSRRQQRRGTVSRPEWNDRRDESRPRTSAGAALPACLERSPCTAPERPPGRRPGTAPAIAASGAHWRIAAIGSANTPSRILRD